MKNNVYIKKILLIFSVVIIGIICMTLPINNVTAETSGKINHQIHNDLVTFVDETTDLEQSIASITDETYLPSSRKWTGMPSIITAGNNIFCAFQTGGLKEPDDNKLNYIVVAVSQDGGNTWIDPFIIIDSTVETDQLMVPQFYYNAEGRLYMLFASGIRCIELLNADSEDLSLISYTGPFNIGAPNSSFTKPTVLSNGDIIYASGTVNSYVFKSTDGGQSFTKIGDIYSSAPESCQKYSESIIIEKEDGILWHIRRLDYATNGGMEQSFSLDGGYTWSIGQSNLPYPFFSPGSRFAMQRLKSGHILLITNASGNGYTNRYEMTAYLSTDDGETWPYELLLDREVSSYPDFTDDEDGNIYISFDADRYGEGAIKFMKITEEDIMAGKIISEDSIPLSNICRCNDEYNDITEIVSGFTDGTKYEVGTSLKNIIKNFSTTVTVKLTDGTTRSITGQYKADGTYDSNTAGTYKVYFNATLPSTIKDPYSKLHFEVILENNDTSGNEEESEESKKGCNSSISSSIIITSIVLSLAFIFRKKKQKI